MSAFTLLLNDAPDFQLECPACKHAFWVNPTTEENLKRTHRSNDIVLAAWCSSCGLVDVPADPHKERRGESHIR